MLILNASRVATYVLTKKQMDFARPLRGVPLVAFLVALMPAATLERLSTREMVLQSTDIVRGRVLTSSVSLRGPQGRGILYTHYSIQVIERWKGNSANKLDLAVPGGSMNNVRQTFPGTPTLNPDTEYVFFLWTGRSGLTQIIGLSQGLLNVQLDASGQTIVGRGASSEPMVDASGKSVNDTGFSTTLGNFRATLRSYGLVEK